MSKPKMNTPAPVVLAPVAAPIPYNVSTAITGTCNSCGRKGVKVNPGNHKGYGRCINMKDCEIARFRKANPHKALPTAKKVVVMVYRHNQPYYFRREYSTTYTTEGKKVSTKNFYWELIPERHRSTRMSAQEANALVDEWGARAIEEG